jgi:hypothetical protein
VILDLIRQFESLREEKLVAHNMDNDLVYRWYGSWKDFGAASPVD